MSVTPSPDDRRPSRRVSTTARSHNPSPYRHTSDGQDGLVRALNERIIGHLSRATHELASFAAVIDDPGRARQLLACIEQVDATIARVRTIAFDPATDGDR